MEKAAELGMTLEQYEVYLKEEKLKVRRAIQAARTEIKRKKMSDTMKKRWQDPYYRAKYASKRRQPVSDETKKKISAKIKELWAEGKFNETLRRQDYESEEWRFKISQSLKKRWEQPDFREKMIDVLKSRKSGWKAVLSESIRAKWSEPEYREKVQKKSLLSIQAKSEDKQPRPEQPLKPAKDLNAPKLVSRNSTKVSMEERNAKFELKQQKKDDEKKKKEQEKVEKKIAKGESKARLNHAKNKVAAGEVKSGELKGIMGDQLWEDEKVG
ncbi:MAG: hypothetical protein EOP04_09445 [Proteobacteria bacterium]|nr:MAG: hypothetical protein EOP04_09445 [Pseudomonadota bacterium]